MVSLNTLKPSKSRNNTECWYSWVFWPRSNRCCRRSRKRRRLDSPVRPAWNELCGLLFGSFALRDIAICEDELGDFTLLVPDGAGHRFQIPPCAVLVADAVFKFCPHSVVAGFAGQPPVP